MLSPISNVSISLATNYDTKINPAASADEDLLLTSQTLPSPTDVDSDDDDAFIDAADQWEDEVIEETTSRPQLLAKTTEQEEIENDDDYLDAKDAWDDDIGPALTELFSEDDYNKFYGVTPENDDFTPRWMKWADKAANFSEATIGKAIIEGTKGAVGETVGSMVGAAFPEATVAFQVGKKVAEAKLPDSEKKSMLATGAGVVAALTVTALTTSLSYFTGTPMEYNRGVAYMVNAAGTLAGGMAGLEAAGQKVSKGHVLRTAASMGATSAVGTAASVLSQVVQNVPVVNTAVNVAGTVATTVAAAAAYYGPEVVTHGPTVVDKILHQQASPANLYDPGEFALNIVANAHGDTNAVSSSMAKKLVDSPLLLSLTRLLLAHTIDRKIATSAIARSINKLSELMQDPAIQKKVAELKANPSVQTKEALVSALRAAIENQFGVVERQVANITRNKAAAAVPSIVNSILTLMHDKEVEFFGSELSNNAQTKALLESVLPELIPMLAVYLKREALSPTDLTSDEVNGLYQNLNAALFAPYNDYKIAKGAKGILSAGLSLLQNHAQFLPKLLSEKIGCSLVDPIITLDDNPDFDINKIEVPAEVKPERKKSVWSTIRDKLGLIRTIVRIIGVKKFMQVVKTTLIKFFINKVRNKFS